MIDIYMGDTEHPESARPTENPPEQTDDPSVTDSVQAYGQPPAVAVSHKSPRGNISFMTIIGQIEGHMVLPPHNKTTKYEHVIPHLFMAAESTDIDGLLILLNTVGGDVEAGLAIAELIAGLGKPTVSLVIGGGHSIGVPLAVAADYSYIAPSATMTIHPVRLNGVVIGAPQTYDYFDKMQERILNFIVENAKISKARLKALMLDTSKLALDVGTILIGAEAVCEKLIDASGGVQDALEKLYKLIEEKREKINEVENRQKNT